MNERYMELDKQASDYYWSLDDGERKAEAYTKKFAELIVGECMACATWVGKMNTNAIEPVHTAHAINQRIVQHFGVEE